MQIVLLEALCLLCVEHICHRATYACTIHSIAMRDVASQAEQLSKKGMQLTADKAAVESTLNLKEDEVRQVPSWFTTRGKQT